MRKIARGGQAKALATYYRRKAQIKKYGVKGLLRRSSKPNKQRQSAVPQSIKNLILNLRRDHPTYGKMKIHAILCRDHAVSISELTVGRILKDFMEKGIIQKYQASYALLKWTVGLNWWV